MQLASQKQTIMIIDKPNVNFFYVYILVLKFFLNF